MKKPLLFALGGFKRQLDRPWLANLVERVEAAVGAPEPGPLANVCVERPNRALVRGAEVPLAEVHQEAAC